MPNLKIFPGKTGASKTSKIGAKPLAGLLALVATIAALACGGSTPTAPASQSQSAPATQAQAATSLSGTIEIDGSSTVFPVSEAVAEEFRKVHPDVRVNVGVSGTGGGFKRFTAGEIDISDASRHIKDAEAQTAADNGIEYHPLRVAMDGLSVLVNPNNDFVECLTTDQLKAIWEPGSSVQKWSDVDPSWPDNDIVLYGPDTDSGTFDYFTEEIMGEAQLSRPDYTASADDNVLVQGIAGGRYSLGYFGYAYYAENQDKLKLVDVDSGNGCITPTSETIENGTYSPLARPLFIYVSKQSMQRPEVKTFVEFYLDNAADLATEVGYIRLGEAEYASNRAMIQGPPVAAPAMQAPAPVAMDLSGTIEIDGSSTVFPVSEAVAEEFRKVHPDVRVNVGVSGTGGGFKRFTAGEIDISDASRHIKDAEAQTAADNGIEYYPLRVAMDGLSVLVNPNNDFVECLTTDQLKAIWEPGSSVQKWSDVDPSWPDNDIVLYGPDTDSGTFDYFTEEIMGEAQLSRPDYTASADDNVLVQGIAGGRYSLGYFGFAYYAENQDKLKLVAVDSGNGCVTPTAESIENGTYSPLARPLFIYVSKQSMQRPEVKTFVEFYLDNAAELATEVGYIRLGEAEYASNRALITE